MAKRISFLIIIFFSILLIGNLDIITGNDLSFSIFYLFPILFAVWIFGRIFGIIIVLTSSASWIIAELVTRRFNISLFVLSWNTAVRLGFFVIILFLFSALKKQFDQEKKLSRIDLLTGLANTKAFFERANIERSRCRRNKTPLTIAYLDRDYFKTVNDTFGHRTGDAILKIIANAMQSNTRLIDVVAQIAGDEFLILLPETKKEAAEKVVSRIQNKLTELMKGHNWPVTFSIGVAIFINPLDSIDEMIARADNLMYSAKNNGRNLICCAEFK